MTDEYIPGVCNIGPAETARRRRAGQAGAAATVALAAFLTITRAPRPWRLLLALPATVSAVGSSRPPSLLRRLRLAGVFNFGGLGAAESVEEAAPGKRTAAPRGASVSSRRRSGRQSPCSACGRGVAAPAPAPAPAADRAPRPYSASFRRYSSHQSLESTRTKSAATVSHSSRRSAPVHLQQDVLHRVGRGRR